MWKNLVEPDRPQMTILRMRSACWIRNAKNTLSQYNTFPRQQLLHARVLIVTLYIHRLSCYVSPHISILSVMDLNNYIISFKH